MTPGRWLGRDRCNDTCQLGPENRLGRDRCNDTWAGAGTGKLSRKMGLRKIGAGPLVSVGVPVRVAVLPQGPQRIPRRLRGLKGMELEAPGARWDRNVV